MPIGDYDKRVVILTKEKGKIHAFARGAKRTKSHLLAATQAFTWGEFEVYPGKNAYTLVKAEIEHSFMEIILDPERIAYGYYVLEFLDLVSQEELASKDILNLAYITLNQIRKSDLSLPLIKSIFDLRMLVEEGLAPNVFECQVCKAKEDLTGYITLKGGSICHHCQEHSLIDEQVLPATLFAIKYCIQIPLAKLYHFQLKEVVEKNFISVVNAHRKYYLPHLFKSEKMIQDFSLLESN